MENKKFDVVGFVMDFEDGSASNEQIIDGFQNMIDSGIVWFLQGSYGRMATSLIEEGYCTEKRN